MWLPHGVHAVHWIVASCAPHKNPGEAILQREKLSLQSHSSLEALPLDKPVDCFPLAQSMRALTSGLIFVKQKVSPFLSLAIMMIH